LCAPQPHRLTLHDAPFGAVLDDSYNANPESALAALEALATLSTPHPGRAFVYGEMLGLGEESAHWHRIVLSRAIELGIDPVFPVGAAAQQAARELPAAWRPSIVETDTNEIGTLATAVRARLGTGDPTVLLVKGSRSLGLDSLVAALTS
jgi:UDP-N-acetylmuramoyl-tripeptide--D-alanyl-D-alanine ligase